MSDKKENHCPMPRHGAEGGMDNEKAWNYAIGIKWETTVASRSYG